MRPLKIVFAVLGTLTLTVGLGGLTYLRASLPQLEGGAVLPGADAAVTVERDALGVPTIRGEGRLDVARATGFVHAQERFFQMDLLRRLAAGELAALVGPAAVDADRGNRVHRLRRVARQVVAHASPEQRELLRAYTEGVNSGLAALGARPFEYALLRASPTSWRPEDSVLVILSMYLDLQDEYGVREAALARMRAALPEELFAFLTASGTEWDAPLDGSRVARARIPGPEIVDLREGAPPSDPVAHEQWTDDRLVGSNSWAVAGTRSADGRAWLANDMHLGLSMPNVWYRARLVWQEDGRRYDIVGASLPGTPAIVVGSNGDVAWGFTNSYGDWVDRVVVEVDPEDPQRYATADGSRVFDESVESIEVKGGEPVELRIRDTIWGPVVGEGADGRPHALRWVAHLPEATNLGLLGLERVRTLEEALDVANRAGVPAQNFVAVDGDNRIGWTIIGRMPQRQGYDPRLPSPWAESGVGWQGWVEPERYPRIVDPQEHILWTANNRLVGGEALELIGNGGYALGARAMQIRDGLRAMDAAGPDELLALQLDDRALFLSRWRELMLSVLSKDATAADPRRAELRRRVLEWQGRAGVDAVGYRLVRAYRGFVIQDLLQDLTAEARKQDSEFRVPALPQAEGAIWRLLTERPPHLLDPAHASWDAQLLAMADQVVERFWKDGAGFDGARWGERNRLSMPHPLSQALPMLAEWLDAPDEPLPGDAHMPRVQAPSHGASQRLVVSPGAEGRSFFHMPGGQSGHPLSPYYRRGHDDWVTGRASPLLPGEPVHRLELAPSRRSASDPN